MGYFNYFIKCVIRKFVNTIFKPKVFLVVFITICLLYLFGGSSRAEWTDDDISYLFESFSSITSNQGTIISQLSNIGVDVSQMETILNDTKTEIELMRQNTFMINSNLIKVINNLNTISTNISNIYEKLDANQKELLTELEKDNQAVLDELNMIRDAINGTEEEQTTFVDNGIIVPSDTTTTINRLKCISLNYENRYSYVLKIYYKQGSNYNYDARVYATDNVIPQDFKFSDYLSSFSYLGSVPSGNSTVVFTYNVPSTNPKYIYLRAGLNIEKIEVFRSIRGIADSLNQSNDLQQQQNQLQQEGNQLQQEQNDFLKDDNVNTDGFEFATDDTVNPTSEGFNTLFNTIYNTFCNTSSEPLTITLPYINKTFTIQPNIVSNAMQKSGLGVVVGLINSFYYFSVCLFIYKDISKIVDNLKSGNITSDCGNVKTEVL